MAVPIEKSLASYDIFNWLDDNERRELHGDYEFLSLELLAEIHVKKPGYVNILPRSGAGMSLTQQSQEEDNNGVFKSWKLRDDDDIASSKKEVINSSEGERLWVTGFSLAKQKGELHTVDVESGVVSRVNDRTRKAIKWPNEVASVPKEIHHATNNNEPHIKENELEDALLVMCTQSHN